MYISNANAKWKVINYYKKSYIDKFWEFREGRDFFYWNVKQGTVKD